MCVAGDPIGREGLFVSPRQLAEIKTLQRSLIVTKMWIFVEQTTPEEEREREREWCRKVLAEFTRSFGILEYLEKLEI